jgi:hypothetical protein
MRVVVEQAVQRSTPIRLGTSLGPDDGVDADQVVKAVTARDGLIKEVDLFQSVEQPPRIRRADSQQGGGSVRLVVQARVQPERGERLLLLGG